MVVSRMNAKGYFRKVFIRRYWHTPVMEVGLSECVHGCKIYLCRDGKRRVSHSSTYGCRGGM